MPDSGKSQARARTRRSSGIADFEELFHLIIENVRDYAIFILDPDGAVLTWNVGVGRLLGYKEREFLGLPFHALFRADDQDGARREMDRAAEAGRSEDERWHVRQDGSELWVSGVLTGLRDHAGHLRGFAKIMRDTTAQREATLEREDLLRRELRSRQQAEEANRTKDAFLATISHELRTPLNAMLGWTRMLSTRDLDPAQARRALTIVERNAQAQAQLVAELLDVSRIATGKLELHLAPVALDRVIDSAVESMQHVAVSKDVTIGTAVRSGSWTIHGDPDRLQQVMLNLLSNAIKFTPPGGRIEIELSSESDDIQVIVQDTGQGIAPELLPHIFDQFQQGERGEAPTSGLGLGLAIARHIVELHHGTIEARSDGRGQGTRFVIRLPRGTSSLLERVADSDATANEPRVDVRGKTALIVEDPQEGPSLTAHVLQSYGMHVLTADSVEIALATLTAEPVDVIVSEVRLSGESDGLDLMRELRSLETPAAGVPAVAVLRNFDIDDRARALAAGYNVLLSPPLDPGRLIEAVMTVLR